MDIIILLTIIAITYAVVKQNKANQYSEPISNREGNEISTAVLPPGYNPFILNQFQEMKDVIFSADLRENRIETKPSIKRKGVYSITQNQIKFHNKDAITIVYGPKHTLNI